MKSCFVVSVRNGTLRVASGSMVWNTIGCSSTRLDVVVKHETSTMHKEAISLELSDSSDSNLDHMFRKGCSMEFDALIDAQKVMFFLIQHNLPVFTLYEPLIDLYIRLGATNLSFLSKSENANYRSNRTAEEFVTCQAQVVQKEVEEKVNDGEVYGLMAG